MKFADALVKETSWTTTENGRYCMSTTGDDLLNLYAVIGALRGTDKDRILNLFDRAVAEDKLLATKMLFYARDRQGLGERQTFRTLLAYAAKQYPEMIVPNIPLIGFYGRYDDLYSLVGTPLESDMWEYMKAQFDKDWEAYLAKKPCSLLAKWIKTPDASSKNTRKMGITTSQRLGYKNVGAFKYRLKALRRYLNIVEIQVSANSFDTIAYESVPSRAMLRYRNLFMRKDTERFNEYIEKVSKGEASIKAANLYPYDIVHKIMVKHQYDAVLEEQWKALPNYVEDGSNILVVADTSGSMTWVLDQLPMASSVGLAIYFAEKAKGDFHNKFMTFSTNPSLIDIGVGDLRRKIDQVRRASFGGSTNIDAAFRLILNTAVKNEIPAEEIPRALVIISDMQFDRGIDDVKQTFHDEWTAKFAKHGYELPNIVYWNVAGRADTFHANSGSARVQMFSGHSASTFKNLLETLNCTPVEAMLKVLLDKRYEQVTVA